MVDVIREGRVFQKTHGTGRRSFCLTGHHQMIFEGAHVSHRGPNVGKAHAIDLPFVGSNLDLVLIHVEGG